MATSGTHFFQKSNLTLFIVEAYERLGILGDNLTAQQIQAVNRSLNFLLTEWMTDGIPLWRVEEKIMSLIKGQNTYDLPETVLDIFEMNLRQKETQDTVMTSISRSEWMALPNKNQPGTPTCFYFAKTIKPTMSLWPCPTQAKSFLFFTCTVMMEDAGDLLNEVQIPSSFYESLVAGMAMKLAVKYAPQKMQMMQELYRRVYAQAKAQDVQQQPLRIGVSWGGGYTW